MASSVSDFTSRVVVAGLNEDGRSAVVVDEVAQTRAPTPVVTINDVWQVDAVPCPVLGDSTLSGTLDLVPPKGGVLVRVAAFPPDAEWQDGGGYDEAFSAVGAEEAAVDGEDAGFHATDTVDVGTVVAGELHAVLEDGEVLLRPGDTFVQRGTRHAWSNRGDEPAIVVFTMVSATR
ncbi:cupin domain-containing protein [Nitriliruptor alkaliphilus]|uniref:cupin domain-containing protein n=1 Tax=Nitriliruptor alkaliphilus TaxID=427918 RepID=UPI000696F293|nr:cupin domain-containing protein [Nitriliruptor alkaliphilus]